MLSLLIRVCRCERGVSAMEFGLILPILVMFSAGTVEYSRLIIMTHKLQSGAFILADLTARDKVLQTEQLGHIFLAIDQVVRPFDFTTNGRAIVTSVGADTGDTPMVNWQCDGAGALVVASDVGTLPGGAATLPDDIPLVHGETVIAAEVFYDFRPLFGIGVQPRTIRRVAFFKPRIGDLSTMTCPA